MGRLLLGAVTLLCAAAPLLLLHRVGLVETWDAFDRYTDALLRFPDENPLTVPDAAASQRDYARLDADLVRWHSAMIQVTSRVEGMAVVGLMSNTDSGLELEFGRQAGSERRALKSAFYAPRDGALAAYLALSTAAYFSRSLPLAAVALTLSVLNLLVVARLKGMSDALLKAAEQLPLEAFLQLPLEGGALALQQQAVLLAKLRAMSDEWGGRRFCLSFTVPLLGSLSVSGTLMASLAAATSVRCGARILRGLPPSVRHLFVRQRPHHAHSHNGNLEGPAHSKRE